MSHRARCKAIFRFGTRKTPAVAINLLPSSRGPRVGKSIVSRTKSLKKPGGPGGSGDGKGRGDSSFPKQESERASDFKGTLFVAPPLLPLETQKWKEKNSFSLTTTTEKRSLFLSSVASLSSAMESRSSKVSSLNRNGLNRRGTSSNETLSCLTWPWSRGLRTS